MYLIRLLLLVAYCVFFLVVVFAFIYSFSGYKHRFQMLMTCRTLKRPNLNIISLLPGHNVKLKKEEENIHFAIYTFVEFGGNNLAAFRNRTCMESTVCALRTQCWRMFTHMPTYSRCWMTHCINMTHVWVPVARRENRKQKNNQNSSDSDLLCCREADAKFHWAFW